MYTPIIKGKAGELDAIKWLSDEMQAELRAFVDVPRITRADLAKTNIDALLGKFAKRMASSFRASPTPIVDLFDIDPDYRSLDGTHPAILTFDLLSNCGQEAVPAVGLDRDRAYVDAIKLLVSKGCDELALRLLREDMEVPSLTNDAIRTLIEELGIVPEKIHLMLDLRSIYPLLYQDILSTVKSALSSLLYLGRYKSVSMAGSPMPENFSEHVPTGGEGHIERTEYRLWRELMRSSGELARVPNYGDYGIVHPEYFDLDIRLIFNSMGPKSRYTLADSWYVVRGKSFQSHPDGYLQYHAIAQCIVDHPDFCGGEFSEGDRRIYRKANHLEGPGMPGQWVTIDMNHHFAFVLNQLR